MEQGSTSTLEDAIVACGLPGDLQLSPDGKWLAWSLNPYGIDGDHPEGTIWLAPADGSSTGRQFTSGSGRDTMPRWAPDSSSIAFLSDRSERGTAGLYILPVDGGEARQLVQRQSEIQAFAWSPDGKTIAFLSPDEPADEDKRREEERDDPDVYGERWPYARLHVLDVDSGEVRTLPSGDRHVDELTWAPDGSQIAFLARPTPELETRVRTAVFRIDVRGGEAERVSGHPGQAMESLVWSLDGKHLLFIAGHEPVISSDTVYALDPSGGEPWVIGPGETEEACAAGIRSVPGESRLVMSIAQGLSTRLEWLDPATGAREPLYAPSRGNIQGEASVVASGGDGPRLAVVHSTGDQPPEVHVGSPGSLERISEHHAALSGFTFGAQEPFYWTADDGLELDGVLVRPPDAGEGPLPTVVLVHGGPYGRFSESWNFNPFNWGQWLAVHGFAVLMPNYRGGLGHGNTFAKWAHGGVGDKEFNDVMSAVDAAVERGIADPDRLAIGGWSQGGFLTAWAVTQTDRFKAGVMGAGVSDWNMMVMSSDVPTMESMLGGSRPWDGAGPHRGVQHSPISYAREVRTPLLILHGRNDERVPVTQAIGFHRALQETDAPTELVIYPREPHGVRERNHQRDVLRRVRDWLQKWL